MGDLRRWRALEDECFRDHWTGSGNKVNPGFLAVGNLLMVTGSMDETWMEVRQAVSSSALSKPFRRLLGHTLPQPLLHASLAYFPHLEVSWSVLHCRL